MQRPDAFIRTLFATTTIFVPPTLATRPLAAFSLKLSAHPGHFAPSIPATRPSDASTVVLSATTIILLRPTLATPQRVALTPQLAVTTLTIAPRMAHVPRAAPVIAELLASHATFLLAIAVMEVSVSVALLHVAHPLRHVSTAPALPLRSNRYALV